MNRRGAKATANPAGGRQSEGARGDRATPPRDRDDADVAATRAWGLYGQGDWEEAVREIRDGLQHSPDSLDLHYVEGLTLKRLGRKPEAATAFREALLKVDRVQDKTRAAMLRRLVVGHINMLEQGGWNLEPETWVRA